MSARAVVRHLMLGVFWSGSLLGQQKPDAAVPAMLEFPVALQQSVESGKTPVGTKVQAKLTVATLVNRAVIPRDAVFSGVVTESVAKAAKHPARLAIRIDTVQWKDGSSSIKACLSPWYYPKTVAGGPNLDYGPPQPPNRTWNGEGQYPSTDSRVYRPFPGGDSDSQSAIPNTPSSSTSSRPARMENVSIEPAVDGGIVLTSKHGNLKLDKLTTYVLVAVGK